LTAAGEPPRGNDFDLSLLDILACPKCLAELGHEAGHLRCRSCRCRYPIREDGVPALHAQAREEAAA
jgi:uncharacterized protein YbaR (Trm112 family)